MRVKETVKKVVKKIGDFWREHPVISGAIVIGTGLVALALTTEGDEREDVQYLELHRYEPTDKIGNDMDKVREYVLSAADSWDNNAEYDKTVISEGFMIEYCKTDTVDCLDYIPVNVMKTIERG